MVDFINGLLNGEFAEMSADAKAEWFSRLLNRVFAYVEKLMGLDAE